MQKHRTRSVVAPAKGPAINDDASWSDCPHCHETGRVQRSPAGFAQVPQTLRREHVEPFTKERQAGKKKR